MRARMIHMMRCKGMTRRLARIILRKDRHLTQVYSLGAKEISELYKIPAERAIRLHNEIHCVHLQRQTKNDMNRYRIVTWYDGEYPPLLREIRDAPLVLYAIGDLGLFRKQPALSVIGTRKPSRESYRKTSAMIDPLIVSGWTIVSGLARGIDGQAHERTLFMDGRTIAVLGSGFDCIYPKEHRHLAQKIAETGLLVSEYPPDRPAQKYHFPERNRIISGLSYGIVVIEALARSGTMITVDQALDQGREVYAVPDSFFLPQAGGCHDLIRQGAKLVSSGTEIMEDWLNYGSRQYKSLLKEETCEFDKSE